MSRLRLWLGRALLWLIEPAELERNRRRRVDGEARATIEGARRYFTGPPSATSGEPR